MFSQVWKLTAGVLGVLAVALLIAALYFRGTAAVSDARADKAEQEADQARAEVDALTKTLETERKRVNEMTAIAKDYEEQKDAAAAESDRIIADLRAGNLRLRSQWKGCPSGGVSETGAASASADEESRLREQGSADLVRIAAEADAAVRALQEIVDADRK